MAMAFVLPGMNTNPSVDVPLFLVDAFARQPFEGNPAAVCLLHAAGDGAGRWPADAWLQALAAEMNQAETAFVLPRAASAADQSSYQLRWFTPRIEVDLCGHATLAAASILWSEGRVPAEHPIGFTTRSGLLLARLRSMGFIELDFPLEPEQPADAPAELLTALAVEPRYVGRSRFDYLVEVASEADLRAIEPDFRLLGKVACRGVIVTACSECDEFDFVSRFFAPAAGIDEDPVTGSAHCTLASFWRDRLGRDTFRAFQASRRGGIVEVSVLGQRVLLAGAAQKVFAGRWLGG